jgi:hypothetical protein
MECFGKRLSPLMRFSACNFFGKDAVEEMRMSLFLGEDGDENEGEMKSNNIVEDRYILSSLSDDAMLFCFG